MGTDSAIFRTLGTKTAMRTDQYNSRWLNGKCAVQPLSDWWDSGIARVTFPQDFQRAPNMLLPQKLSGHCICFRKSGNADLQQTIPQIVFGPLIFLHIFSLADPTFIHVHLIPDSAERNDDKLYFFFREKSSEMGQSPVTQSRIGRICLVCRHREACVFCVENAVKGNSCWFEIKTAQRLARRVPRCVWMFAGRRTRV